MESKITTKQVFAELLNDFMFKNIQDMIVRPDIFSEKEFERLFVLARIANFKTM